MTVQPQFSPQAQVAVSLLRDVEAAEERIAPGASDAWFQAKRLIEGDLALAQQAARQLSGEEASMIVARGHLQEARLYFRFLAPVSKDDLRHAATCAEIACRQFPTAVGHLLLGQIYAEMGENEKARQAFQTAAEGDSGELGIEARKELMRFEKVRRAMAEETSSNKGSAITLMVVGAVVALISLVTYILLLPVGGVMILVGGYNYLKESFVKR
jgi:hypothetical protein